MVSIARGIFDADLFSEVQCKRRSDAKIVWLNRRASTILASLGIHVPGGRGISDFILEEFGVAAATGGELVAYADYYGSTAIDSSVGSGRAACINGVQVKGIGKTGLSPPRADWLHSHGFMSLEEAIREAYFSEIARSEFPCGSIPTIAVLELEEEFSDERGSPLKRGLLLRPFAPRLSHMERAFSLSNTSGRFLKTRHIGDIRRVEAWLCATGLASQETVERAAIAIGAQVAHAHVYHWFNGGFYLSNFSLDGRLVDFGSARRVVSWRAVGYQPLGPAFGSEIPSVKTAFGLMAAGINHYLGLSIDVPAAVSAIESSYINQVFREYSAISDRCALFGKHPIFNDMFSAVEAFQKSFSTAKYRRSAAEALLAERAFTTHHCGAEWRWDMCGREDRDVLQKTIYRMIASGEEFDMGDLIKDVDPVTAWWKPHVLLS